MAKGETKLRTDPGKLWARVFPKGGGDPYDTPVVMNSPSTFKLGKDSGQSFHLAEGSTWKEGTKRITMVFEGHAMSLNPRTMMGKPFPPEVFHGAVEDNLITQLFAYLRSLVGGAWKKMMPWLFAGLAGLALLMLFWQIRTQGAGFEAMADALRDLGNALGSGQGGTDAPAGGGTAEPGSGHQPIAPGDNA